MKLHRNIYNFIYFIQLIDRYAVILIIYFVVYKDRFDNSFEVPIQSIQLSLCLIRFIRNSLSSGLEYQLHDFLFIPYFVGLARLQRSLIYELATLLILIYN
jgi:hypothetical protein